MAMAKVVKKSGGSRAEKAAKCAADEIAGMTPRERARALRRLKRELAAFAPTLEVAKSDPLRALLLVGAEFIARYFPDASSASFHVTKYPPERTGPAEYSVMIPMAVPRPEGGA